MRCSSLTRCEMPEFACCPECLNRLFCFLVELLCYIIDPKSFSIAHTEPIEHFSRGNSAASYALAMPV